MSFKRNLWNISQTSKEEPKDHNTSLLGENRQLVTDELVELEKYPVEVQDCRKMTDRFRGIYRIYPQFNKGKPEDVNM